jgi:hypothetical protein
LNYQFSFRQRILIAAHQWPYPFAAFVIGALFALGIAFLVPVRYTAETRLSVSYHADAIFRNVDDFKNWETEQLNAIILSGPVLTSTLEKLKASDPYWEDYSTRDLAQNLNVYWQNVGIWRLVATSRDAAHARQLVLTWEQAALDTINQALSHSAELTNLNLKLQAIAQAEIANQLRFTELDQIKQSLNDWLSVANQNQAVDELQRWRLQFLAAQITPSDGVSLELLQSFPESGSPLDDYSSWLGKAIALDEEQIAIVQSQQPVIAQQKQETTQEWQGTYYASQGLSSYLQVEAPSDFQPSVHAQRSNALMALVGGLLGVLCWTIYWLALPFLGGRS